MKRNKKMKRSPVKRAEILDVLFFISGALVGALTMLSLQGMKW